MRDYDDDSIKYYLIAVMKLNFNSKTSPFYYRIRKESRNYTELKPNYVDYNKGDTMEEVLEYENLISTVEEELRPIVHCEMWPVMHCTVWPMVYCALWLVVQ